MWLLPHLGELVMLGPLGDALRTLASVDALHLDARCCAGLWLLRAGRGRRARERRGLAVRGSRAPYWLPC